MHIPIWFFFNVGYVTTTLPDNANAKPGITPITKSAGYNKPTYPVLMSECI